MKKIIVFLECALVVAVLGVVAKNIVIDKEFSSDNMEANTNSVEVLSNSLSKKNEDNSTRVNNVSVTDSEDTEDKAAKMQEFSDWASSQKIYGFLLSEYDDPADANFWQIFGWGGGIDYSPNSNPDAFNDPAVVSYLQKNECEVDSGIIYKTDMDADLEDLIGLSSDEINYNFDWIDTSKGKALVLMFGDTNYASFKCIDYNKEGDIYTLKFKPASECFTVPVDDSYSDFISVENITMKVRDKGDCSYQILSNHFQ